METIYSHPRIYRWRLWLPIGTLVAAYVYILWPPLSADPDSASPWSSLLLGIALAVFLGVSITPTLQLARSIAWRGSELTARTYLFRTVTLDVEAIIEVRRYHTRRLSGQGFKMMRLVTDRDKITVMDTLEHYDDFISRLIEQNVPVSGPFRSTVWERLVYGRPLYNRPDNKPNL